MTGRETYNLFHAIKFHFNSSLAYNFTKYAGKGLMPSDSAWIKKSNKYYYEKLGHNKKDYLLKYFVANFVEHDIMWIGDLDSSTAEGNYLQWKKRIESLSYVFESELNDIKSLLEKHDTTFDSLFKTKDGEHPVLFRLLLQKMICIETYIIMDLILGFTKNWKSSIDDKYIYPEVQYKCDRYNEFMNFEVNKFKPILQKVFL